MKLENKNSPNVTLEDLFALKRAEQPPQEFWDNFQQEFHVRQRAAAIEPKRWWFVLPRVLANVSRYQMPVGAAAVLAVTFLSFREYSEPGFEIAYTAGGAASSALAVPVSESSGEDLVVSVVSEVAKQSPVFTEAVAANTDAVTVLDEPMAISPMVGWAGAPVSNAAVISQPTSPSARSIAANLAVIEAERAPIGGLLNGPAMTSFSSVTRDEPLASVTVSEPSRERLFAYQGAIGDLAMNEESSGNVDVHSRIARRLNDDLLYDSVRRLTAGGDRLTLKF